MLSFAYRRRRRRRQLSEGQGHARASREGAIDAPPPLLRTALAGCSYHGDHLLTPIVGDRERGREGGREEESRGSSINLSVDAQAV